MTPMAIIVAATRNAAHVCGLDATLGTLEAGKEADILVVDGNPLWDLDALTAVRAVIHGGVVIRQDVARRAVTRRDPIWSQGGVAPPPML